MQTIIALPTLSWETSPILFRRSSLHESPVFDHSSRHQDRKMEPTGPDGDVKSYSCLPCRQRKVKCDRQTPCTNCVKTERQCSFIAPTRGKRKRTKPPREGLHAKLQRYEELLKSYGAKLEPAEPPEDADFSESEMASQADLEEPNVRTKVEKEPSGEETKGKLVTSDGTSRYFERYVCQALFE